MEETTIKEITSQLVGLTFSYNGEFRTKNNPRLDLFEEGKFKIIGDIDKDPQIYKTLLGFKLILSIDPKWIATTTAFVNLRPPGGKGLFAGIATIKQIDIENKVISATPLIIGIPKTLFSELFSQGLLV